MKLNSNGQAFDAYKLLIGAIIALAVLAIIVGVINYFENLSIKICRDELEGALLTASHVPDGQTVSTVRECVFEADATINSKQLGEVINIPTECISFEAADSSSFETISNSTGIHFSYKAKVPVFIRCNQTDSEECPEMECCLSFARKPTGCEN